jgi:dTMP kinase
MKGFFIALEGIDGCGKSTQLKALAEWLPASGLMPDGAQLVVTREPGGTSHVINLNYCYLWRIVHKM